MDLVAVTTGRTGAVVADRQGQEVEYQVGVPDLLVAAHEAAALEVVRRPRTAPEEQPVEADPRPAPLLGDRLHREGLEALVLEVDLEVVLEVPPDRRQVVHDVD